MKDAGSGFTEITRRTDGGADCAITLTTGIMTFNIGDEISISECHQDGLDQQFDDLYSSILLPKLK